MGFAVLRKEDNGNAGRPRKGHGSAKAQRSKEASARDDANGRAISKEFKTSGVNGNGHFAVPVKGKKPDQAPVSVISRVLIRKDPPG